MLFQPYQVNGDKKFAILTIHHQIFDTPGVPQGSIVDPLLGLLFIDDITNVTVCNALLHAYDLEIHREIISEDDCFIFRTNQLRLMVLS